MLSFINNNLLLIDRISSLVINSIILSIQSIHNVTILLATSISVCNKENMQFFIRIQYINISVTQLFIIDDDGVEVDYFFGNFKFSYINFNN